MRLIFAAAVCALAACGQPPVETPPEVVAAEATEPAAAPGPSAGIDGWEIDMTAYEKIGQPLPAFTVKAGGADVASDTLRGKWTILGLMPATEPVSPDESSFLAALSSAVDQDPELDLLVIQPAPAAGAASAPLQWPAADDTGAARSALALPASPGYLLIGPDLTIEGYRGALSATPDDGIKSVVRGVAEVRKQIAAPQ